MNIEVGKTAYIRTSREEVFVLGVKNLEGNENPFPQAGTTIFAVRRPTAGQNGVIHMTEFYYPGELITREGMDAEREAEQAAYMKKIEAARSEAEQGLNDEAPEPNVISIN